MSNQTDIDIDVLNRDVVLSKIRHVPASINKNGVYTKHNSGVYVSKIPHDPISNLASIEYKEAEERGYFKLDFLNNSLYDGVRDESHLISLMEQEPVWDLFQHEEVVQNLAHVSNHIEVLRVLKPQTIEISLILSKFISRLDVDLVRIQLVKDIRNHRTRILNLGTEVH